MKGLFMPKNARLSTLDEIIAKAIETRLIEVSGNIQDAADSLGICRATIYNKVGQKARDKAKKASNRMQAS